MDCDLMSGEWIDSRPMMVGLKAKTEGDAR
jgi:hypothetical protein